MTQMEERLSALGDKYTKETVETGLKLQPRTFGDRLALRDGLDQHFTKLWLDFAIAGIGRRQVLDNRTRLLVLVGQFTMSKNPSALEDTIRAAIGARVPAREVMEVILQCTIYGGQPTVDLALDVFVRVAEDLGVLEEVRGSRLPLDGHDRERVMEEERQHWHEDDLADPRREDLMERHGWLGVSTGLRLRPKHHLDILAYLDALDPEFANLWVNFCYHGMYSRWIVDDKTRLLCMVGDCMAVGETTQARAHMRGAMRQGAKPREVMEVVLMSCVNFGMPTMLRGLKVFVNIMAEQGRLEEIGNPPLPVE